MKADRFYNDTVPHEGYLVNTSLSLVTALVWKVNNSLTGDHDERSDFETQP
jgi:hypothetical protein